MGKPDERLLFLNPEDAVIPEGIPDAALWRLLIMPVQPRTVSRGGIVLPDVAVDNTEHFTYIGKILSMGPLAGKKENWAEDAYPYKPGDWVLFGRYAGQRFEFQGLKLLFLDDDNVLGHAKGGPDGFRIYI